jgi:hypothetical protein
MGIHCGRPVTRPPAGRSGGMHIRRNSHTATLLGDGTVLIAGGYSPIGDGQVASAEIFDPRSLLFHPIAPMGTARAGHMAVLLGDGSVLVAGGKRDRVGALGTAELYRPSTGVWTPLPSMLSARSFSIALRLADGRVLIAGGAAAGGDTTGAETYPG